MRLAFQSLLVFLALSWCVFLAAGNRIAGLLGDRIGGSIQRIAKGKVSDPVVFTYERAREFLLLSTVFVILSLVLWLLAKFLQQRRCKYAWAYNCLAIFAALNVFILPALNTALFWGAMFTGNRTANYTQFQFKRILADEQKAPRSALLLGSSQTQAQIDENQLNALIGTNLWTTELHFPGSCGLDVLLAYEQLRETRADYLLIYISEGYFFNGLHTEAPPFFARLQHIPLYRSFGLGRELVSEPFRNGYFGQVIPLLRAREATTHRVLGVALGLIGQETHDAALEVNLEKRAESVAQLFEDGPFADVQKRAFAEFIRRASSDGRKVILFEGQLNPMLSKHLPPSLRNETKTFLREIAAGHSNVELIGESEQPRQEVGDYSDLTHVTAAGQLKFTLWLSDYLRKKLQLENPRVD
jgi:hypothetical protein